MRIGPEGGEAVDAGRLQAKIARARIKTRGQPLWESPFFIAQMDKEFLLAWR